MGRLFSAALLAASMLVYVGAGCGKKKEDAMPPEAVKAEETVTAPVDKGKATTTTVNMSVPGNLKNPNLKK